MLAQNTPQNKTLRQCLVNQASRWLFNWNWRAFRQEAGDPHPADYLSESIKEYSKRVTGKEPLPYAVRDYADAHAALENAVYHLKGDCPQVLTYYVNLSDKGFNRLFNEVTRKANERLERRKDVYLFALDRASEGNTEWIARLDKVRGFQR